MASPEPIALFCEVSAMAEDCRICRGPFNIEVTRTLCCKKPIHLKCRRQYGQECPYCGGSPSKPLILADIFLKAELDHNSSDYAKTTTVIERMQRHQVAIANVPQHSCEGCQIFHASERILCNNISRNPPNCSAMQSALNRMTAARTPNTL